MGKGGTISNTGANIKTKKKKKGGAQRDYPKYTSDVFGGGSGGKVWVKQTKSPGGKVKPSTKGCA